MALPRVSKPQGPAARGTGTVEKFAVKFPDWIPQSVRDLAQIMYANRNTADSQLLPLLTRLTSDPRMRKVWSELLRRKRIDYVPTDDFLHPASAPGRHTSWTPQAKSKRERAGELRKLGGSNLGEAARLDACATLAELLGTHFLFPWQAGQELPPQDLALACFFDQLVRLARNQPKPVSLAEARRVRNRYLAIAKRIRADAAEQERVKGFADDRLWAAAYAYEELADVAAPPEGSPLLVQRKHRSDATLKGFVIALTDITQAIFQSRLVGTVANAANVVFNRDDVTDARVRKMLRTTPLPLKPASKGS
jgi:hypothetical protein